MVDATPLLPLVREFFEHDPAVAARSLERLDEDQAAAVLAALPPNVVARTIQHLQLSYAAALLRQPDAGQFREIMAALEPQFAASLFMNLPPESRQELLEQLSGERKAQIRDLLTYPEDSVGRLMTTNFLAFDKDLLAQEAIERIRILANRRFPASYVYVVDADRHLIGVMNMRDLMLAAPEQTLESIMRRDVFTLHCFTERAAAAAELSKRRYFAAPVVDGENHILGIIKAEWLIQGVQDDVTQDMQRMFGAGGDERVSSSLAFSTRKRLPWLHVNLATAFLAAGVVALFEDIIARITILAIFLPVVAGQGGNAGAQSLAVVMRGLVMREVPKNGVWRVIVKEGKLGAINGSVTGLVTALVAWGWYGNPYLGVVIGVGMLINLICAGLAGASIPILMKKLGLDPAQCSSIVLTTVTDVMGFLAFLGLAVLFQSRLG